MKNQKGFSAVEGLLILVIVGLIGGVGWYVWQSKKNSDASLRQAESTEITAAGKKKERATQTEQQPVDETANWLLYKPPGKEFKMRLADGWELMWQVDFTNLAAYKDIDHKPGVKAKVTETTGGRGGPFSFYLLLSNKEYAEKRGELQSEFKTNSGLIGKKYVFVQQEDGLGDDIQKGDKEYTYYFNKNGKYIYINHSVFGSYKDNKELVEKAIKTLEIN